MKEMGKKRDKAKVKSQEKSMMKAKKKRKSKKKLKYYNLKNRKNHLMMKNSRLPIIKRIHYTKLNR